MLKHQAIDAESRGKLAYNSGCIKTYAEAEKYARKKYNSGLLQDCFVAGWNMANWDAIGEQLKKGSK